MEPLQRADALLARMTLEEKAFQLTSVMGPSLSGPGGADPERLTGRLGHGIGQVSGLASFGAKPPADVARTVNGIQRFLVEKTRLGIPAIFHNEALNGVMAPGFTVFPTGIALAATWDPESVGRMAALIGRQMRAIGMRQALSPVLDVARDARWGRIHETYGEDPYLVSALGVAYVRGLQGEDVLATAKHFLGYGVTEGGQNMAATAVGARELYEVHARPFEAAIHLAGLASVMNSYSEYDGVPVGASHTILTELLRERMGFTGTVVADYMTIEWLASRQRIAADSQEAGVLALAAGLDVELPDIAGYGAPLAEAVKAGRIGEDVLDRSVRRVLRDKFALGLFDDPYVDEDPIVIRRTAAEGTDLARELARKAVTLLKNEDAVLPLAPGIRKVAVVGPLADDVSAAFPTYTYPAMRKMLMRSAAGSAMPGTESVSDGSASSLAAEMASAAALGGDVWIRGEYDTLSLAEAVRQALPDAEVTGVSVPPGGEMDGIPAAVAAARDADVVILALGGHAGWLPDGTEGEGHDTADIELPAVQAQLVKEITATGTPAIAVVQTGRPFTITSVVDQLTAAVWAFYGGQEGTRAIADILTGAAEPGGRLPYSIPRHVGQVPLHHGQKTGTGYRRTDQDMHRGYLDLPATPLFAFGHGLGYTTFSYGELTLDAAEVPVDGTVTVSVQVTNTGDRPGDEVVQLYFHDTATGLTRPAQELVGFRRLHLAAGATATVEFTVRMSQLGYVGLDGTFVLEPGPVDVSVGAASDDIRTTGRFEITGDTITLDGRRSYLSEAVTRQS
ncbi:glycoside hydrolase family 3 C-terminal domain-containing protein [Streptomyces mirabilis]|uniref:beta-glucosidase family protein n=1 Tax=Streptomyces mirabilis TaxID=68239 RepID=UPI002255C1E4|nr:glycoside hydrolase family 3 N-terminal domain-containing protein [Streptomyces mirabilis]MCX5356239.1 glycoside hydrolase family 3 C-terminal domain-containing protein [Streptomyces mirabilis]